jgi:hypothetical protein
MRNIGNEVKEVNDVEEIKDSESAALNFRGVRMAGDGLGFSFTSWTSFTSFISLAFTGVYA